MTESVLTVQLSIEYQLHIVFLHYVIIGVLQINKKLMEFEKPKEYTTDEISELERKRTISEGQLLEEGAEYKVNDKGEKILIPTRKQYIGLQKLTEKQERNLLRELRSEKTIAKELGLEFREIARDISGINEHTKAYIGKLEPGIFEAIQKHNIGYVHFGLDTWTPYQNNIFDSFNQKIDCEIGGESIQEIKNQLKSKKIATSKFSEKMLGSADFNTLENVENIDLIRLTLRDLGLTEGVSINTIYQKAKELGLDLCPAEIGPRYPYDDEYRYTTDIYYIAMEPIGPYIFSLKNSGGRKLQGTLAGNRWPLNSIFIFRLPKITNSKEVTTTPN